MYVAFKEGRKFYLLPVLSVGDAFAEIGRKGAISQPLLPLLHLPHSYFTLLPKQRICFSDVGINFPVYGTTVTPYEEPTVTPPPTTTTSITPYVTDEDPEDTTLSPTPGKLDPIAGKRDNMVQKV